MKNTITFIALLNSPRPLRILCLDIVPDKDLEWGCSGNLGPKLGSQLVPGSPSKDSPLWIGGGGGEGGGLIQHI